MNPPSIHENAEYPGADPMAGLRMPNPVKIARRAARRALQYNPDNIFLNPRESISNIFRNPMQSMQRPASPVRQQPPNPESRRQRRKASKRQKEERASKVASGWIYGGRKTKRRRRY
jgi:hypothetical protein